MFDRKIITPIPNTKLKEASLLQTRRSNPTINVFLKKNSVFPNPPIQITINRSERIRNETHPIKAPKSIQSLTGKCSSGNPDTKRARDRTSTPRNGYLGGKGRRKEAPFGSARWWFRRPGSSLAAAAAWTSAAASPSPFGWLAAGFGLLAGGVWVFRGVWSIWGWGAARAGGVVKAVAVTREPLNRRTARPARQRGMREIENNN